MSSAGSDKDVGNGRILDEGEIQQSVQRRDEAGADRSETGRSVVFARLLVGLVVLICAEVFSGASLKMGLWHPWTLLMTYWLYFAHFFFFTTLAVRTGRTSFWSLYLWGVLFGLYESWITKVIWYGYSGDGKFAMGSIGPYGISEMSMVLIFHPIMSFVIPLAVTCLLCPPLRRLFPELAWFTGKSKSARIVQGYLIFSFAPVMAMNSGGPLNLAVNLAVAIIVLVLLSRLARSALSSKDGRAIVVFGRSGFVGLCVYLSCLYAFMYFFLRPEGLPSAAVQLFTFVFYALAIAGLCLRRRRDLFDANAVRVENRELRLVIVLFAVMLVLALALSPLRQNPILLVILVLNFVTWTLLGGLLFVTSIVNSVRERMARIRPPRGPSGGGYAPAGL